MRRARADVEHRRAGGTSGTARPGGTEGRSGSARCSRRRRPRGPARAERRLGAFHDGQINLAKLQKKEFFLTIPQAGLYLVLAKAQIYASETGSVSCSLRRLGKEYHDESQASGPGGTVSMQILETFPKNAKARLACRANTDPIGAGIHFYKITALRLSGFLNVGQ